MSLTVIATRIASLSSGLSDLLELPEEKAKEALAKRQEKDIKRLDTIFADIAPLIRQDIEEYIDQVMLDDLTPLELAWYDLSEIKANYEIFTIEEQYESLSGVVEILDETAERLHQIDEEIE